MLIIPRDFYLLSATEAAPALCGMLLCVKGDDGNVIRRRITETECYYGEEDTACHAHRGMTERTRTLYLEGGVAYVYLCYGIHNLFNIVTGSAGHPEAVLIRGVEGAPGPGLLTRALGITRDHNGVSLIDSGIIWCEDDGYRPDKIEASPRVGIAYASEADRLRPWRFTIRINYI